MSKSNPKSNFLQTMLIVTTLFLGFQLLTGGLNKRTDPRGAADFMQALEKQSAEIKKVAKDSNKSISQVLRDFESAGRPIEVRAAVPSLSAKDAYRQLQIAHEFGMDVTAPQLLGSYIEKVEAQSKAKEITQDEADRQRLQAYMLVADAQAQAGIIRNDRERLYQGYLTLHGHVREFQSKPYWTQPMSLTPDKTIAPEAMFKTMVNDLSLRNKHALVWGLFPGYGLIDFLVRLTGSVPAFSYAFAAFLLALVVRAVVWPLSQKQLMFSRQMMQLQPLAKELKDKYTGVELNQKTMELYRDYGINPAAGCLPAVLQMPLFLMIYQCMVMYQFEFQKGTFLWINEGLSKATGGFIAPNLGERDYVMLIIYAVSMITTTLLSPVSDPANARQQRLMGVSIALVFTVFMFFWPLPSAFVLYWTFTNILSTAQSLRGYRMPVPPLVKVNAPGGGTFPGSFQRPGAATGSTNGHVSTDMFRSTGAPKVHKPRPKKKS